MKYKSHGNGRSKTGGRESEMAIFDHIVRIVKVSFNIHALYLISSISYLKSLAQRYNRVLLKSKNLS